jgi:hypothetical protein
MIARVQGNRGNCAKLDAQLTKIEVGSDKTAAQNVFRATGGIAEQQQKTTYT